MQRPYNFASAFLCVAILAACGGDNSGLSSSMPLSVARTQPVSGRYVPHGVRKTAWAEKALYTFAGGKDGELPANMQLVDVNGSLYGTTGLGGGSGCKGGCGTVFKIAPSGKESVLYRFKGGSTDGEYPRGGLVDVDGTLYGATESGGTNNGGTFFKITTSGTETILYSFGGAIGSGYDGFAPYATLIYVSGVFYGTTIFGGSSDNCTNNCGTVFRITRLGKERILHSFTGGKDGEFVTASLVYKNGELYGTTQEGGGGGSSACTGSSGPIGCGIVFSVSTSGTEKVLYAFTGGTDGAFPTSGLIDVNGTLYGMAGGGGNACYTVASGTYGCGTIFSVSASGAVQGIYDFKGPPNDGAFPYGSLINEKGVLYGTTTGGGGSTACTEFSTTGCGTILNVSTAGKEHMLYSFNGAPDGSFAQTTLLDVKGVFYGTTNYGGAGCGSGNGCGTVFTLSK